MPIGMNDYLRNIKDPFDSGLFENMYRLSDWMKLFPYSDIGAPFLNADREGDLPSPGMRKLNADFTETTSKFGDVYEDELGIAGSVFTEDIASADWKKVPKYVDPVEREYKRHMKAIERYICNMLINGDRDTNELEFNGLWKRFDSGEFPASQLIYAAGTGAADSLKVFASAANAQTFFEKLDEAMFQAGVWGTPDITSFKGAIMTNRAGILGFQKAAKLTGYSIQTVDLLGKRWLNYMGVPLVEAGLQRDKSTEIISNTYTDDDGTHAVSSRMYVVRFSPPDGQVDSPGSDGLGMIGAGSLKRLAPVKVSSTRTEHALQWQVGLAHPGDDYCAAVVKNFAWAAS